MSIYGMSLPVFVSVGVLWNTLLLCASLLLVFCIQLASSTVPFALHVEPFVMQLLVCLAVASFGTFLAYVCRSVGALLGTASLLIGMDTIMWICDMIAAISGAKVPPVLWVVLAGIHPASFYSWVPIARFTPLTLALIFASMAMFWATMAGVCDWILLHPGFRLRLKHLFVQRPTSLSSGNPVDADVQAEIDHVDNSDGSADLLRLRHIGKVFGKTIAVRDVTMGVRGGTSLAFLGGQPLFRLPTSRAF